jgi:hypothetical protein
MMDVMDQCREMMGNMMSGGMMDGMMGNSFILLILAGLLIVWLISVAVIGALGYLAVKRFAR